MILLASTTNTDYLGCSIDFHLLGHFYRSTADGVTPHGLEQKKDSAHTSSGWSVPSSKESPKASSISQQQIDTEYEKTKHHMEESGYSLTIISPKPFSGNLEDLPPNVLLVCGDDFWKFTQGFIVHLIASR